MLHPISSLRGYRLAASDGDIGQVKDMYFDSHEWIVRYLVAHTGVWLFGKDVLISPNALGLISVANESIPVELTQEKIKNAPDIDTARPVSRQQEIAYYDYYGYAPYYWAGYTPWGIMPSPASMASPVSPAMHAAGDASARARRSEAEESEDRHLRSATRPFFAEKTR